MTKRRPLPDAEYLRSLFAYEPDTGLLRWKVERGGKLPGDIAGAKREENGYLQVSIDNRLYRVHLVIWKMVTGTEPVAMIDHWDTIKGNNRWGNLREATKSQNQANVGLTKANTSGFKGVYINKKTGRYVAQIVKDSRTYCLGTYDTPEEAALAYEAKAIELYGSYARMK